MSPRRARLPALALDDLKAWLASQPDIARRNWTVSAINGFCAALVVGPERIATDAWLRVIFGPSLPTTPMGLAAVQAVLDHRHAIHNLHGRLFIRVIYCHLFIGSLKFIQVVR